MWLLVLWPGILLAILSSRSTATAQPQARLVHSPRVFDYIIVGGGTAGLALSARLSENPEVSVAVLEAGPDFKGMVPEGLFVDSPATDVLGSGGDRSDNVQNKIDWGIVTTPQAGANGRSVHYARGKTLGGSSARNFMIYQRPTAGSHTAWQQLTGDRSWGFAERLSDYQRGITFTPIDVKHRPDASFVPDDSAAFDRAGGPLHVSYPQYVQKFSLSMKASLLELGYPAAASFNEGTLRGVQACTTTINPSNRNFRSSSRDFFQATWMRPNLRVFTSTSATQILFKGKRAIGVKATNALGLTKTFAARKEVILSAGVFQSPQLLMVSGIGPRAELAKFNITPLVVNEAVGQHMEDHVFAGISYPVNVPTFTRMAVDIVNAASNFIELQLTGDGPGTTNAADHIGWERLNASTLNAIGAGVLDDYPRDHPHLEYLPVPGLTKNFSNLLKDNNEAGRDGTEFATILAALVAPLSKGSVTLRSPSMADLPVVDPGWLTHPVDRAVAIQAFKNIRRMFSTKAMSGILAGPEYWPGKHVQTDQEILEFWKDNLMTVWHASSTCRMSSSPAKGVIDSHFRVFGVNGLRVVDASSFAKLLPGHPQSVLYMLANRAADLILASR